MKLELKHLAGYLPYELEAQDLNTKEVRLVTLLHFTYNRKTVGHNHLIYEGLLLSKHSPILRPLSDLTKEIEVNGEKFVPILELYKIRTQHLTDKIDKYYIENDTAILKLEEITTPDGRLSFIHYFEIDIEPSGVHFSICTETIDNNTDEIIEERFGFIGNEFNMLQKLQEWHFDIYGLIPAGLAIDINTTL